MRMKTILILVAAISLLFGGASLAQATDPDIRVFTYEKVLKRGDTLTDGDLGKKIEIDDETLLVWIDLEPGARFTHPTVYALISADKIRIIDGGWWPVLNGRSAFGTPPDFPETDYLVRFPVDVDDAYPGPTLPPDPVEDIKVYAYPFALRYGDLLSDDSWREPLRIRDDTMLFWIDWHPSMKFVHDTSYLVIGPDGVEEYDGLWWPELNGRQILYGERNDWGVVSAFDLYFE